MRKRNMVLLISIIFLLLCLTEKSYAEREHKRTLGIGLPVSLLSFYTGPTVNYWFTDLNIAGKYSENIGLSGSYFPVGSFTGYSFRAMYSFNKNFKIYENVLGPMHPYVSFGYAHFEETTSTAGMDVTTSGGGMELSVGVDFNLKSFPQLYFNYGLILTPFSLKATIDKPAGEECLLGFCVPTPGIHEETEASFGMFTIGFGATYYFW